MTNICHHPKKKDQCHNGQRFNHNIGRHREAGVTTVPNQGHLELKRSGVLLINSRPQIDFDRRKFPKGFDGVAKRSQSRSRHIPPRYPFLPNGYAHSLGKTQNFHIKSPAVYSLFRKELFGDCGRKQLEAALCIGDSIN